MIGQVAAAVPAVAGLLAYTDAKWRLREDWRALHSSIPTIKWFERRAAADQVNSFYILEAHAQNPKVANKPFIVYQGRTWTFKQAYEISLRYAGWLHTTHKIAQGEFVAVDMMNCPQFVFLTLGLWSLGAIPAFINYNLSGQAFIHSVRVSTARVLITESEVEAKIFTPETREALSSPTFRNDALPLEIVVLDAGKLSSLEYYPPYRAPDSARGGVTGRDPCALIFTSGTTGLPKAAIAPWVRVFGAGEVFARFMGLRSVTSAQPDRYYTAMPLYHSSGFVVCFHACLTHATTFVLGRKFSVSGFWEDVRQGGVTVVQYVGETLRYLLAAPPSPNDRNHAVRMAFGNGLRADVWERFRTRFGVDTICEFYGATEGPSGQSNFSRNSFSAGAVGAQGLVCDILGRKTSALVQVDWDEEAPYRSPATGFCIRVPKGQIGELLIALDAADIQATFQGYLANEKATESKILRDVFKKGDAWFRTGDVLRKDEDYRMWFSDRIGDTFRWKSENVSTSEVAEVFGHHPQIHEANVYGVEVPGYEGRAGCAALLVHNTALDEHGSLKPEILQSLAVRGTKNLPKYAVPVFLRVVKQMEITGNNKQQKTALRKEGVDPANTAQDRVFWLRPGGDRYEPFGPKEWESITKGVVKL